MDIPVKPTMPKTRLIHNGARYNASVLASGGLIVQHNGTGRGVQFPDTVSADWIHAIVTAIDDDERELLCKALLAYAPQATCESI
jgi:hypothetical protein